MNNLCIIPARGGSKRIPRKNIKEFLGKPIIAYSIEAALQSNLFTEVMVSTDDEEIASIASKYGASVPFMRSKKNADDFATTFDVIEEVVEEYKKRGQEFTAICCIYSCAPFVTSEKVKKAFELMQSGKYDSAFPIIEYAAPIQRSLSINEGKIAYVFPENSLKRSQDLAISYHDAGQFYWMKTDKVLSNKVIVTDNSGGIIISQLEGQDIDNESDWKLAELKYKLRDELS